MAKRVQQQDPVNAFLDAVFKGLWWLISYPFRDKNKAAALEKQKAFFRQHWQVIEGQATNDMRLAIMQADILLDQALQAYGMSGNTLGERLKSAQGRLSQDVLNSAWNAHKVRNKLAHELHYQVTGHEGQQTLSQFKTVIRHLGLM